MSSDEPMDAGVSERSEVRRRIAQMAPVLAQDPLAHASGRFRSGKVGGLALLIGAAPLLSGLVRGPVRDSRRKAPRWKVLGYASEAEYCNRT